jgi:hypothetical protein
MRMTSNLRKYFKSFQKLGFCNIYVTARAASTVSVLAETVPLFQISLSLPFLRRINNKKHQKVFFVQAML